MLLALTLSLALAWVWLLGRTLRAFHALPRELPPSLPSFALPPVSVLLPARNESGRMLRQCVLSLLEQEYPELEIVAVNDCSQDDTGQQLKELAEQHPRLRVLAGTPPPAGWLGKPHALAQARASARFGLLLAADADVVWRRDALARGASHLLRNNLDCVTLFPRVRMESFWERVTLPVISWMLVVSNPFHRANDPSAPAALASGAFVLFRRQAQDRIGGYASVAGQINEDSWTVRLLKRSRARVWAGDGSALLETRLCDGLAGILEGFGRSMYPAAGNSRAAAARVALATAALGLGPAVALTAASTTVAMAVALLAWGLLTATMAFLMRRMRAAPGYALLAPLGFFVTVATLVGSAWRMETRSGVLWKGRRVLRAGEGDSPVGAGLEPAPTSFLTRRASSKSG